MLYQLLFGGSAFLHFKMSIRGSCLHRHRTALLVVIVGLILSFVMLGMECGTFGLLGKCVNPVLYPSPRLLFLLLKSSATWTSHQ